MRKITPLAKERLISAELSHGVAVPCFARLRFGPPWAESPLPRC